MLQGKPSRRVWVAAIAVSLVCVSGLAYALISDWDTELEPRPDVVAKQQQVSRGNGGFYFGLALGIGAGIVIGSLIALAKRDQGQRRSRHSSRSNP